MSNRRIIRATAHATQIWNVWAWSTIIDVFIISNMISIIISSPIVVISSFIGIFTIIIIINIIVIDIAIIIIIMRSIVSNTTSYIVIIIVFVIIIVILGIIKNYISIMSESLSMEFSFWLSPLLLWSFLIPTSTLLVLLLRTLSLLLSPNDLMMLLRLLFDFKNLFHF